MKSLYLNELRSGDDLSSEPFLLHEVIHRTTKDGRPYLLCTLGDRTGQVGMVFWDVPDEVENWARPGLVVRVSGRVVNYKDALQINANDIMPLESPNMSDFLPTSARPRHEMIAELRKFINSLEQPWQGLVAHLLLEDEFLNRFANAPAARTMHHAYVGGLLEHTLSMATLADLLAIHYPHVNRSLLLAGTLLHDMGKTSEYTTEPTFAFSDDGRLVGHITRAALLVEKAAAELGVVPEDWLRQLVHLILSHHGTTEWGSPVVPKTLEAILLHQLDLLDSRVQGYFDHLRSDSGDGPWTLRTSYMFNTELRRPPGFKS